MAPVVAGELIKRFGYYNECYDDCNSAWVRWGRWVLFGVIIFVAIFAFFCCSCLTARRRRKQGNQPIYGTGWTLGMTPMGHSKPQYNQNVAPQQEQPYHQNQQQTPYYNTADTAPPAYSGAGQSQGYYGNAGVQAPNATYNGQYAPPKDPPPHHM